MDVRYRYNLVTGVIKEPRADSANVSRALNDNPGFGRGHLEPLDGFVDNKQYAAPCRFTPAGRAAEVDRFSSHDGRHCVTCVHGVGIHDPCHRLLVGIHIGRRDVLLWSNEVEQLCGITPRHALQLAHRHLLRIADDSALRASKRNIDDSTLPRHPRGESADLVEAHVGRVAYSALGWTTREVV